MLKRFIWKENDVYSVQLTGELYILAQLLTKPYAAFSMIAIAIDRKCYSSKESREI